MNGTPIRRLGESILVVKDEPEFLDGVASLLLDLGYQVIPVANGSQALAALNENPEIDLLFTDIVLLGGLDGRELAEAVMKAQPAIGCSPSGFVRQIEGMF